MADDDVRQMPVRNPSVTGTRLGDRFNFSKVSWGAIWAGVMVTLGMEALFIAFGLFIDGLVGGSNPWSIVWYLVTMCISFYVGGRSAAQLSDIADRDICILHGLATWGLATVATLLIEGVVWFAALLKTPLPVAATIGWGLTALYGGTIWGGALLGLCASYFGGVGGIPRLAVQGSPSAEAPQEPLRRVS
jgi:hypothetical protein